jgi:hypothetical protein
MTGTYSYPFSISVFALCIAGLVSMAALIPLFWPRKYRFTYRAGLSAFLLVALIVLWCRDHNAHDDAAIGLHLITARSSRGYTIYAASMADHLSLQFVLSGGPLLRPVALPSSADGSIQRWVKSSSSGWGPLTLREEGGGAWMAPGAIHFSDWGFEGLFSPHWGSPPPASTVGMVIPDWFAAMTLAWPIGHWIYYHFWGRALLRRRHGLCTHCGYSLQGLSEPVRCPECGLPGMPSSEIRRSVPAGAAETASFTRNSNGQFK